MSDRQLSLPAALQQQVRQAGFYPELMLDTLELAVGGEQVVSSLVQGEATFDTESVRMHLTVLVLTTSRLVFLHADDHPGDDEHGGLPHAFASTESVPLTAINSVAMTHVVSDPQQYVPGSMGDELNLAIAKGGVQRLDLEPAGCADPQCEADHGFTGTSVPEDLAIRVSAQVDGPETLAKAIEFARTLSAAVTRG